MTKNAKDKGVTPILCGAADCAEEFIPKTKKQKYCPACQARAKKKSIQQVEDTPDMAEVEAKNIVDSQATATPTASDDTDQNSILADRIQDAFDALHGTGKHEGSSADIGAQTLIENSAGHDAIEPIWLNGSALKVPVDITTALPLKEWPKKGAALADVSNNGHAIGMYIGAREFDIAIDIDDQRACMPHTPLGRAWELNDWAQAFIKRILAEGNPYIEISTSNTGLHIVGKISAAMPPHKLKLTDADGKVYGELFSTHKKHYLHLTGRGAGGSMQGAVSVDTLLEFFPTTFSNVAKTDAQDADNPAAAIETVGKGEVNNWEATAHSELLKTTLRTAPEKGAWEAKSLRQMLLKATEAPYPYGSFHPRIESLYHNEVEQITRYNHFVKSDGKVIDYSHCDYKLAKALLYVNGLNEAKVIQLMRESELNGVRENTPEAPNAKAKWDSPRAFGRMPHTYLTWTIKKAMVELDGNFLTEGAEEKSREAERKRDKARAAEAAVGSTVGLSKKFSRDDA